MLTHVTVLGIAEPYRSLIKELVADKACYEFSMKNSPAGQKLLAMSAEEQRSFVLASFSNSVKLRTMPICCMISSIS